MNLSLLQCPRVQREGRVRWAHRLFFLPSYLLLFAQVHLDSQCRAGMELHIPRTVPLHGPYQVAISTLLSWSKTGPDSFDHYVKKPPTCAMQVILGHPCIPLHPTVPQFPKLGNFQTPVQEPAPGVKIGTVWELWV